MEDSRFLSRGDRQILAQLRRNPENFVGGTQSLFTEAMLRRAAGGWATNLDEIDAEGRRLFGRRYAVVRYESLVAEPFRELNRLWRFLGVKSVPRGLSAKVRSEMHSNPDEEWQARRGQNLASFLAKGKSGNWRALFTRKDCEIFKDATGDTLVRWKYERTADW